MTAALALLVTEIAGAEMVAPSKALHRIRMDARAIRSFHFTLLSTKGPGQITGPFSPR